MQIISNVYTDLEEEKKIKKMIKAVSKYKPVKSLYLITMPLSKEALLEVYNYNMLIQPIFKERDKEIIIVGITDKKKSANMLLRDITEDCLKKSGGLDIPEFIRNCFTLSPVKKRRFKKR